MHQSPNASTVCDDSGEPPSGVAQVLPVQQPLGVGQDIAGEKFGLLTAKYVVSKTQYGNQWLLQCSCGRYAVRLLATLRQALRNGNESMCSECLRELRRGSAISYRQQQKEKLLEYYALFGTLWPPGYIDFLRKDIRRTVMERLGAWAADDEDDDKSSRRITSLAQDLNGNIVSVAEHLEVYDAEQCDNGCGDMNQEGFKLPPLNALRIPWLSESAEEKAERLEQAERHAMKRAKARQEAEAAKLKEQRHDEWKKAKAKQAEEKKHEGATQELYQLRAMSRDVIAQALANHPQSPKEEKRAADEVQVPPCFGLMYSSTHVDCVGDGLHDTGCILADKCKQADKPPRCYGTYSFMAEECTGRHGSGGCALVRECAAYTRQNQRSLAEQARRAKQQ